MYVCVCVCTHTCHVHYKFQKKVPIFFKFYYYILLLGVNVASTKETIGRRTTHYVVSFVCLKYTFILYIYIMAQWTKKSLEPWKMVVAAEGGGVGGKGKDRRAYYFFKDCVIE